MGYWAALFCFNTEEEGVGAEEGKGTEEMEKNKEEEEKKEEEIVEVEQKECYFCLLSSVNYASYVCELCLVFEGVQISKKNGISNERREIF